MLTRTRCWTAVFAFRPLSSSYLCRLYWAFHFLCLWLNIHCSKLSSDIKRGWDSFLKFLRDFSNWNVCLCSSLLSALAVPANTALSSYHPFVTLASPYRLQTYPVPHGRQMTRVVLWSRNVWTSGTVDQANIIFLEMQPVSSTAPFVHYLVLCLLLSGDYLVNRQLFVC